jgi:hypothetical protein
MCNIGTACGSTSVSIPAYSVVRYVNNTFTSWMAW